MTQADVVEISSNLQATIDKLESVLTGLDGVTFEDSDGIGEPIAVDLDDGDVEDWHTVLVQARDECEALSMHLERSL